MTASCRLLFSTKCSKVFTLYQTFYKVNWSWQSLQFFESCLWWIKNFRITLSWILSSGKNFCPYPTILQLTFLKTWPNFKMFFWWSSNNLPKSFEIQVFYTSLDIMISQLEHRFTSLHTIDENFLFLKSTNLTSLTMKNYQKRLNPLLTIIHCNGTEWRLSLIHI